MNVMTILQGILMMVIDLMLLPMMTILQGILMMVIHLMLLPLIDEWPPYATTDRKSVV